jgi:hypothetical protein
MFNLMICAATLTDVDCSYKRPCIVWKTDIEDELKYL